MQDSPYTAGQRRRSLRARCFHRLLSSTRLNAGAMTPFGA